MMGLNGFAAQQIGHGFALAHDAMFCAVHQYFRRARTGVVVGSHDEGIRARAEQRKPVAGLLLGQRTVLREKIGRFADGPDQIGGNELSSRALLLQRNDFMIRIVKRGRMRSFIAASTITKVFLPVFLM